MKKTTIWFLLAILTLSACQINAQQKITDQQKSETMTIVHSTQKQNVITTQERDHAIQFLKATELDVFKVVKDLNKAQLAFKPAADKWSVEDCVKHIAAAEQNLWIMVEASLKQPANPEQRAGIKFADKELINAVEDRSHKSKTFEALEPANSPYKTVAQALTSFKENREKLIAFVRSTQADLRNHVSVLPIGTYDAYQFILLISAHSNRHKQQIEEVKANINFPKG